MRSRRKENKVTFLIINEEFVMDFIDGWWVSSHCVIYIPMDTFKRLMQQYNVKMSRFTIP